MNRLLSWAASFIAPDSPAQVQQQNTEQEQDGGEEKTSSAPADAYPLDATGWGTCGWPL
ncbi:hypothetical protein [Janthinobacterium sp. LB2P70]|uniref:hypothetical protein n=1 Tax=Janthinobacterium sp. LB2P70 TaxID=3424197 RepID=UPI003F28DCCD